MRGLGAAALCAIFMLCARASEVRAQLACGSLQVEFGQVRIGKPLSPEWVATDEGKRCIGEITEQLKRNRLLRAVTVANHVADAQQAGGKPLSGARLVADALVAAGLPPGRVFAVAPRAESAAATGIVIRYTERAPDNVVARIATLSGPVRIGADETALRKAELQMPILVEDLVDTGADGQALIELKDGSGIRIAPNSRVKMVRMSIAESGERAVSLSVIRGQIEAEVHRAAQGSSFEVSSRVAVASVRGTDFRLTAEPQGDSRLETLEGKVRLGSAISASTQAVDVPAGLGSHARQDGRVETPQPLPAAPTVIAPRKGPLGPSAQLSFTVVPGATEYHIEIARDADLIVDARQLVATATAHVLTEPLAAGKWFWRVTAKSADGFIGLPSKVYSFEVKR